MSGLFGQHKKGMDMLERVQGRAGRMVEASEHLT